MNFYIADSLLSISIPPPPDMDIRTAAGYNTIREKPTAPVRDYVYTLHRNPNTVKEWMNNGEGYLKMGNYDAAVMSFRKVIELEPSHPKVHELLGQVLLNQGRYEEAALSFEKLLKIRPDEPALQLLLADVYQKKGRWVEEEAIYRNLINDKGTLAELKSDAYVRLAQLVGQQQRYWEQEQLRNLFHVIALIWS